MVVFRQLTDSYIRQVVELCRVLLDHRRHANGTETMRKLHDTLSKYGVSQGGRLGGVCQTIYWLFLFRRI